MADLSVGQKVPYFELPDQQDYPWGLSGQLEVGPVVLVFYRGDWCPYCNGQLVSYARAYQEFEKRAAQVAGISVDPPGNNAGMVGKLLLPFPLLSDPRSSTARLRSATSTPAATSLIGPATRRSSRPWTDLTARSGASRAGRSSG
jgi:peroxiredoxin